MATDYSAELRSIEAAIFGRRGEGHVHPTNERMQALVDLLGDPQRAYRSVHLTGTNGKTSTARMVDELLRGFGIRTGRYTSPHLTSVTERIVVDGEPVSEQRFVEAYRELEPYVGLIDERFDVPLSFFEIVTALGFAIFADVPVDVAVVEVGLGGAWDNTNVLDGQVAVVTPIGLDHTEYLGDSVEQIAREKAGIIKPDATAVLALQPAEAQRELLRRTVEVDATVAREGMEFGVVERRVAVGGQFLALQGLGGVYDEIFLPLHGAHQAQNAVVALAAVEAFLGASRSSGPVDLDVVREAFAAVRSPGRLEPIRSAPTVLLDAAHNPSGLQATLAAVAEAFSFRRLVAVVAVMADKDVTGMLELLEPAVDEIVVTEVSGTRRMDVDDLAALAEDVFGRDRVTVEPRLDDAIESAVRLAERSDDPVISGAGVLVTGSVVTVGEARILLGRQR
ncbi:dihydrofolate synthase / folylpolyglutamate synthase [Jatrophihabitans endophyticus]|uniref:Dihydrofolate synthase/folylpolyglutamate synthase n=1 Tax=Jatrophihabitans endophyticus TaxID=1206085 RepID=A0A1M5UPU2_9ACTN|nr:folylpolyglutamate synthase/dihydrofolate synthase family protein [Jatrophihabitans endophyticus]SHH64994.1 dihydrofolate synthase / folylpolyglutamate synthase [Jatrophihabitans endophyticus]